MKGEKLRFKAYRVVVSQATNENQASTIVQALHKLGFHHCITSPEESDLDLAKPTRCPSLGSTHLAKIGLLLAQLVGLSVFA